jgi:hypothetical protein
MEINLNETYLPISYRIPLPDLLLIDQNITVTDVAEQDTDYPTVLNSTLCSTKER